jgi:broad specificity phosphatase PhoE
MKRVLIVTHGGFIGEFMNVVRALLVKPAIYANNARNTAMYIV